LNDSNVSKREWENIKLLLKVDEYIFKPAEFGLFSPHSLLVDLSKYDTTKLPKEAKEILYRPAKVKSLYDKYWQLAEALEGKKKVENDRKILKEYHPRYPQKTAEELKALD
jgi:predicted nucleotidyltransferase